MDMNEAVIMQETQPRGSEEKKKIPWKGEVGAVTTSFIFISGSDRVVIHSLRYEPTEGTVLTGRSIRG